MSRTAHAKLAKRLADAIAARAPLAALTVELSLDEAKRVRRQITTIRADGQVGGINAGAHPGRRKAVSSSTIH
ncbi:MAG: hypothetical protein MI723_17625 [Caulobacterales bacterium]|nr:hypothetical protein [Caulobacterales bacterium]